MSKAPGNIVIIGQDIGIGGVQRKIADIAQVIAAFPSPTASKVYLLLRDALPVEAGTSSLSDVVQNSPIVVRTRADHGSLPFPVYCMWQVLALRPQLILAFLRGPALVAVALKTLIFWRAIQVVISIDAMSSKSISEHVHTRSQIFLLGKLVSIFYRRADRIVSPSNAAKTDLIVNFGISAEKITVNSNWVLNKHQASPVTGRYDLIYVGRLATEKNLEYLVEIIADAVKQLPQIRVAIVGSGEELGNLMRSMVRNKLQDNLSFLGWRNDVAAYLAASSIFCLTSRHEGLSVAALEAMAQGLPVLSTPYAGAEELIRHGKTGYICRNKEEFVDRIIWCLINTEECKAMGRNAREYVTHHHGQAALLDFVGLMMDQ